MDVDKNALAFENAVALDAAEHSQPPGKRQAVKEKNKPWAVLRATRRQYEAARPWKKAGMERKDFEKLIQELPDEFFSHLRDVADAERLADAIFKGADS